MLWVVSELLHVSGYLENVVVKYLPVTAIIANIMYGPSTFY